MVGDILNFVEQVGIPIASALAVGCFLFIIHALTYQAACRRDPL